MVEKSEEQIAKEKASVAAMKSAQSNMMAALDRIGRLETALRGAHSALKGCKVYVGSSACCSPVSAQNPRTVHAWIDACTADIDKVL